MSFDITDDANFLGGIDFSDLTRIGKFNDAVVFTNEISANQTKQFSADESDDFVDKVEVVNPNAILPGVARLVSVKFNIQGSSTDTTLKIHQSSSRREIDKVVEIVDESVDTTPNTFIMGGGVGTPYANKDGEEQIYFEVEEKSGNPAEYQVEFNWLNIR